MKIKVSIWILAIVGLAVMIFQNIEFYLSEHALSFNSMFTKIELPPLVDAIQVGFYLIAGIVLASVYFFHERYHLRREIKGLENAVQFCTQWVIEMQLSESDVAKRSSIKPPIGLLKRDTPSATTTRFSPHQKKKETEDRN